MFKKTVLEWRRKIRRSIRTRLTGKTYLNDLFEMKDFEAAQRDKLIRVQTHNSEPLAIACYTETATYDRVWNDVTLNCRGLIYRTDTYEIIARPWPKFFTYGQPQVPSISLDEPVHVTDKMDGSLGILYRMPSGGWAVATKGSFHSEQAEWATEFFRRRYFYGPYSGNRVTMLFEIIFPSNRIVVDYGGMEDLVLLGAVGITTGKIYGPEEVPGEKRWHGPRTDIFKCATYADALAMPPRPGKEGIVVRTADGRMVKIKQSDYLQLHRIATGLSPRGVWKMMLDGKSLEEILAGLPDEFHGWVKEVYSSIANNVKEVESAARSAYSEAQKISLAAYRGGQVDNPRKAFALALNKTLTDKSIQGYVWQLYDKKQIRYKILENSDPGGIAGIKPSWGNRNPEGAAA